MTQRTEITVILPGYNEADNIEEMLHQVHLAIKPLSRPFEIIYVNDGSTDNSAEKLADAARRMPFLKTLHHRRNFGQSAAILTGYEASEGDIVITMDSDLQNDPADLPRMISCLEKSPADAVCGVRQGRQDNSLKRFSSRVANLVRGWALNDGIQDAGCAMRVVRREALRQLPAFRALHRFLPTILKIHGYTVIEMPVRHRPREAGTSKYGIRNRLFVGISDIMGIRWYRKRHLPPHRLVAAPVVMDHGRNNLITSETQSR